MVDNHIAPSEFNHDYESSDSEPPVGQRQQRQQLKLPPVPLSSKQPVRLKLAFALVGMDVIAFAFAFLVSCFIHFGAVTNPKALQFFILWAGAYVLVAANSRAYGLAALVEPRVGAERALMALVTSAALLVGALFYLKTSALYSRQIAGIGVLASALFIAGGRWAFLQLLLADRRRKLTNDVLLIDGAPIRPQAGELVIIADTLANEDWNPLLLDRIGTFLRHADRVIVAATEDRRQRWVTALKGVGIDVEVLAMELERMRPLELRRYAGHPTLVVGSKPLGLADLLKKRIFDLAVTVSALLLLAPVFAIVAVAIKLDSEGPILFRQPRLGHGNRIFEMLKFRTMRSEESDAAGQVLTAREDNRVTTVGRFLRRTSLDELPQLINVLTGDMSLVGPRPHALHAKAGRDLYWEVHPGYWLRAAVKPGLTGLAQVRGYRGPTETGKHLIDRVDSDLEYLAGWTLSRDVAIIFQTLRVLVHPNAF